jgi:hypothetical protein
MDFDEGKFFLIRAVPMFVINPQAPEFSHMAMPAN